MYFKKISIFVLIMSLSICAATKKEGRPSFNILAALPVDVSSPKDKEKNKWAVAFFDTYIRFRLEPLKEIHLLSKENTFSVLPSVYTFTPTSESQYYVAAQKNGCTYILTPQFEITKNKTVMMNLTVVSTQPKSTLFSFDKEFSLDQIPQQVDSMLIKIFPLIKSPLTAQSTRFFQITIAGPNYKSVKQFGEALYDERNAATPSWSKVANEYERLIQRDPTILIAHASCSDAMIKAGQYDKASKYLKELLNLVPIHSELFITLSASYRYSGKANDAYLITSKFDQMGLLTTPYLFEKAKVFEALKQLTNAYKAYYQILQIEPSHKESLLFCTRFYNNDSKFNNALPFADALIKVDNNNGYAHFERGRSLLGLGKTELACSALSKANELQPSDPVFAEYLGDAKVKLDKQSEAVTWYTKALQANPKNITLLLKTAKSIENSGKAADALALLKTNAPQFVSEPLLKKNIGILEYTNNNFAAATAPLNEYLKTDPNDYDVLFTLGNAYEKTGQFDAALSAFQKAVLRTTSKTDCNMSIARVYIAKKDAKSAQQILKEIIAQRQVKGAYAMLGDVALLNNNSKNALVNYLKERELHGNDRNVQKKIAQLHFATGAFAQSSLEYKRLLKVAPDDSEARYYIAIVMLKDGNTDGAESVLREARTYGDGSIDIFYSLGNEFFSKKKYPRATEFYNKVIAQKPDHEEALYQCALSEINSGNETNAAEHYIKLFDINNAKYSNLLAEAGHLFYKNESNAKAVSAYLLYLNKGFSDPTVNRRYAEIEYANKNYQTVCSLLKNVNGSSKEDKKVLQFLADSRCQTGDYKGALPLLNTLLVSDKNNKLAIKLSAIACEKTNDVKKAISFYELYSNFPKDKEFSSIAFHLGELYESVQMVDNAIARYESSRKLYPEELRFHERLSTIYMKKAMWKEAQDVLEAALESPEAKPEFTKRLAQTYYSRDNIEKAISTWNAYLDRNNTDANGWCELGKIYYSRQNYADAIQVLNKAHQLVPTDFDINALLGKSYVDSREFRKAIVPLGHARKVYPNNLAMIELTARCYRNLNETSSLSALLKEWITLDPKRYDIKMELGSIYLNEHDVTNALAYLNDAVTFLPSEFRPHLLLAQAFELMGNDTLRLQHLEKASKLTGDNWELSYQYARYYLSKNNITEATKNLNKVIALKPEHAASHYELALVYLEKNNAADALKELRTAISHDNTMPIYHAASAYAYALSDMKMESLSSIDAALKSSSQNPSLYYYVAQAYRLNGDKVRASENVAKSLQINPDFAKGYEALGDLSLESYKFKDASKNYFLSWEKGGYNANRALKLGNALVSNLQFNEAKGFYEAILNHDDPSGEAIYRTVLTYCKLGDLKNARKFQKYFQKDDAPWIQLAQGILYESENNSEAALTAYSIAAKIAPENALVYGGFGRIYSQFGQSDLSIDNFKKALKDSLNMQNYIDLATVYQEKGAYDSALTYYKKVNNHFPEHPWVQIYIATLLSQQNDHAGAIAMLQQGIQYHQNDPMLHFLLGQELEQGNKYEDAIKEYQVSLKIGNGQPIEALRNIGTIYLQKLVNDKKAKEYYKKYVKAGGNKEEIADAMKKLEKI